MNFSNIRATYNTIFESYGNPILDEHIKKIDELLSAKEKDIMTL